MGRNTNRGAAEFVLNGRLDAFFVWTEKQQNIESTQLLRPRRSYRSRLFSAQRMEALSALVGRPDRSYQIVHIAGSKGKGSTAYALSQSFAAHGIRVGCYLSPHVFDYRERFLLFPADLLTEAQWVSVAEELRATLKQHFGDMDSPKEHPSFGSIPPTTFEILTLFAFLLFRLANCQWVIVECGLGGRYDSTNVVRPAATVITSVEREHTQYLGWRISSIAAHKAGILKKNVPVFLFSQQKRLAERLIRRRARLLNAPVYAVSLKHPRHLAPRALSAPLTPLAPPDGKITPLFQRINILAAYLVSAYCLAEFSPDAFSAVLTTGAQLPGRYQRITQAPMPLYCDGAHTPSSLLGVARAFTTAYGRGGLCIFGCSVDKNARRLLAILRGSFSRYLFTSGGDVARPMTSPAQLAGYARRLHFKQQACYATEDLTEIADEIRARRLPTLVCGSFYIIAPLMRALGY